MQVWLALARSGVDPALQGDPAVAGSRPGQSRDAACLQGHEATGPLKRAAQAAVRIQNPVNHHHMRSGALAELMPALMQASAADAMSTMAKMLESLSNAPREHLLADLAALAPLISRLGGENVIEPIRDVTERVARWWP